MLTHYAITYLTARVASGWAQLVAKSEHTVRTPGNRARARSPGNKQSSEMMRNMTFSIECQHISRSSAKKLVSIDTESDEFDRTITT